MTQNEKAVRLAALHRGRCFHEAQSALPAA